MLPEGVTCFKTQGMPWGVFQITLLQDRRLEVRNEHFMNGFKTSLDPVTMEHSTSTNFNNIPR